MKPGSRSEAQRQADRIRVFREELAELEREKVFELTLGQHSRLDEWSRARLSELAAQYDVDTTVSQKRVSWGMRIASTPGRARHLRRRGVVLHPLLGIPR